VEIQQTKTQFMTTSTSGVDQSYSMYKVNMVFEGTLEQIAAARYDMDDPTFLAQMQVGFDESAMNGTIVTSSSEFSITVWSFILENYGGTSDTVRDCTKSAFNVAQATVSSDDSNFNVTFQNTTVDIVAINTAIATGENNDAFESCLSAIDSSYEITYQVVDTLSWIYSVTNASCSDTTQVTNAMAESLAINPNQVTAIKTPTASGYDYTFTYTGSVTQLQQVTDNMGESSREDFQDQIQTVSGCADSIVENVEFDQYIDCVSFLFFYTGLCDDVSRILDVVFVLDSSSSFNAETYLDLKEFVLLSLQYLFPAGTKTAALQFATTWREEWKMSDYPELPSGLSQTIAKVNDMIQIGGLTFTDDAITASCAMFPDSNTERDPDRLLMLVTDGEPTQTHDPCDIPNLSEMLGDKTVLVFGIGEDFDPNSNLCLVNNNAEQIFHAPDTANLQTTLQEIANITCPGGSSMPYDGTYEQERFYEWNNQKVYTNVEHESQLVFDREKWIIYDGDIFFRSNSSDSDDEVPPDNDVYILFDDGTVTNYGMRRVGCAVGETPSPTLMPSVSTTLIPVTSPSVSPIDSPSTPMPSLSPTELYCAHLNVYKFGVCPRHVDVIFLVDSSSSMSTNNQYSDMKNFLKDLITTLIQDYPDDQFRFAVTQFSSGDKQPKPQFDLYEHSTSSDPQVQIASYNQSIDDMVLLGGATFTRNAFDYIVENEVEPACGKEPEVILILLTDGQPTTSTLYGEVDQRLCTDTFNAGTVLEGLQAVGVVVGFGPIAAEGSSMDGVKCMASSDSVVFESTALQNVSSGFDTLFNCQGATPYDGRYMNIGSNVYEDHLGNQLEALNALGNWEFKSLDPNVGSMSLIEPLNADRPYPADFGDWTFVNTTSGTSEVFDKVRVLCSTWATPTKSPTGMPFFAPTEIPSSAPFVEPTVAPNQQPSIAPTPKTRPPTSTPIIKPSQQPVGTDYLLAECDNLIVYQGLCQIPTGMDFVFAMDASSGVDEKVFGAFKAMATKLATFVIPNPAGGTNSTLGTMYYSGETQIDFNNDEYFQLYEWLEAIGAMDETNVDFDRVVDVDLGNVVDTAIYDMFPVGLNDDRAMVIFINGAPTEDDCNDWTALNSRGIYTTVFSIGDQDYSNARCLATDENFNYQNFGSVEEALNATLIDYMCDEDFPYDMGFQKVQGVDHTWRSASGIDLTRDEEAWVFNGPGTDFMSSRVTQLNDWPPDKSCWDLTRNSVINETYCMVRIECSTTNIPTLFPTSPPTTDEPTFMPTEIPTSSAPSRTPSIPPTVSTPSTTPTKTPTNLPTYSAPTGSPSMTPVAPTGSPRVSPSAAPTTPQPTKIPSISPSLPPSVAPTVNPSTTPTPAPTDDCLYLIVGLCYCAPTRYDGPVCNETSADDTPFNGKWARTDKITNGKPEYTNGNGDRLFMDAEAWTFFSDSDGTKHVMAETTGEDTLNYPDNHKDWSSYDDSSFEAVPHEDVNICCSNTPIPSKTPSYPPSVVPTQPPTSQPVAQPTTMPTGNPSVTPTRPPSSEDPTTSPSNTPTTTPSNLPSKTPSKTPSRTPSTTPSTTPTTTPTGSPTRTPSKTPSFSPTELPSQAPVPAFPSKTPTSIPTTESPTKGPTQAPVAGPTKGPTTTPTFAPTDDCVHFYVGTCPCNNGSNIDILFLIDGSSSTSEESSMFSNVTTYLANELPEIVPEGMRVAIATFGTTYNLDITFDDPSYPTIDDVAAGLLSLKASGGTTWTLSAMMAAIGAFVNSTADRDLITVLITDGEPSLTQSPCDTDTVQEAYNEAGIDIIPVAISDGASNWHSSISCLPDRFPFQHYTNGEPITDVMVTVFEIINICNDEVTTDTPYNGGYSRMSADKTINGVIIEATWYGYPVYLSSENRVARWNDEVWTFWDPSGILGIMARTESGNQIYPESHKDWVWENKDDVTYDPYHNVIICCQHTATPTRLPSVSPTSDPTVSPSQSPTVIPSENPTVVPSENPTVIPTDIPSPQPSTEEPTFDPTASPSTDEPTVTPSIPPTNNDPSLSPSKGPSKQPTYTGPTTSPSTTCPTTSPIVPPSTRPSTSPSVHPTSSPTDDCEHLIVGDCYCEHVTGEVTCSDPSWENENQWMDTYFNGLYSRNGKTKSGKPVYENNKGWEIYWNNEVWVMIDFAEGFMYGEIGLDLGLHNYPQSLHDYVAVNQTTMITFIKIDVTICCSDNAAPSFFPSTTEPSEPPSVSPTECPSTKPSKTPSVPPSKFPTTTIPSTSPSSSPTTFAPTQFPTTDAPSKSPSRMPTTDTPSQRPSEVPTNPPTVSPSIKPTVVPPSISPTVLPSSAPSPECEYFIVGEGCACTNHTIVDYGIILENTYDMSEGMLQNMVNLIADFIEEDYNGDPNDPQGFPPLGRLSIWTCLGSDVNHPQQLVSFTDDQTRSDIADALRGITRSEVTSGCNVKKAMDEFFDNEFGPDYLSQNRQGFLMVVVDGPPEEAILENNMNDLEKIDVVVNVVAFTEAGVDALNQYSVVPPNTHQYEYYTNQGFGQDFFGQMALTGLFRNLQPNCAYGNYDSPYNGWYTPTATEANDKPVWSDPRQGFYVSFGDEGMWNFLSFNQGPMAQIGGVTEGNQPRTLQNWEFYSVVEEAYISYDQVVICCAPFVQPTVSPTVPPTTIPSENPTADSPSVGPTLPPSSSKPSLPPSISSPTTIPTQIPTDLPTTEEPTQIPTKSPSTDQPSKSPTKFPTTDEPSNIPTKSPSTEEPSHDPTKSPTTSSPSTNPSLPPETPGPTVSPVTLKPSQTPSVKPTKAPTITAPSSSPDTSDPSCIPSTPPSSPPTTDKPTVSPTRPPTTDEPTVSPSTLPTIHPTGDCPHFTITPCTLETVQNIDILWIIDTSTSVSDQDYESFMEDLANSIRLYYPPDTTAAFGLMQFASTNVYKIPIEDGIVPENLALEIEGLTRIGGATYTDSALRGGLEMWKNATDAGITDNTRLTVLVTDGEPSSFQNPCEKSDGGVLDDFAEQGIMLSVIGFGLSQNDAGELTEAFDCFKARDISALTYSTYKNSSEALLEFYGVVDVCALDTTVFTPYDGSYSRAGMKNERPTYVHSEGYTMVWEGESRTDPNGVWLIYDPQGVLGEMRTVEYTPENWPLTDQEWSYNDTVRVSTYSQTPRGDNSIEVYDPVNIVCQITPTPTRMPSNPPTTDPTTDPTRDPSRPPTTDQPSTTPTHPPTYAPHSSSPTENPTKNPTTDEPSKGPTTDQPTQAPSTNPSKYPTTEEPTKFPSRSPTFEEPSKSPSVAPTLPPTTKPSEFPSVVPSFSPTQKPSLSQPTCEPSITPSSSPSTTPVVDPTKNPSAMPSAPPTTMPSNSPTTCEYALAQQNATFQELIDELIANNTGMIHCSECEMAEIEALGEKVGDSSAKIEAYEECRTSDEQLTQLDALETQLETLTTYLNNSNVVAWRTIIEKLTLEGSGCQFVPKEWCNEIIYVEDGVFKQCAYDSGSDQCNSSL